MDGGSTLMATTFNTLPSRNITLVKLDSSGGVQWHKRFGPGNLHAIEIVQTPDSGYFFTAMDWNNNNNAVYTKVDKNGTVVFTLKYPLPSPFSQTYTGGFAVAKNDGGFYIASTIYNSSTGANCWHLIELDNQGILLWSQIYTGTYENSYCKAIDTTANGDIVLLGTGTEPNTSTEMPVLLRTDSSGNITWYRCYKSQGASLDALAFDIDGSDNFYISAAYGVFTSNASFLMKVDSTGNAVWSFQYVVNMGTSPHILSVLSNNSVFVGGLQYFLKVDSSGQPICARKHQQLYMYSFDTLSSSQYSFAGISWTSGNPVFYTSDACGNTCQDSALAYTVIATPVYDSTLSGSSMLILAPTGNSLSQGTVAITTQLLCTAVVSVPENQNPTWQTTIYPSPANDEISVVANAQIDLVEIYDGTGRLISYRTCNSDRLTMEISAYPAGLYFFRVICGGKIEMHQVPIIH